MYEHAVRGEFFFRRVCLLFVLIEGLTMLVSPDSSYYENGWETLADRRNEQSRTLICIKYTVSQNGLGCAQSFFSPQQTIKYVQIVCFQ